MIVKSFDDDETWYNDPAVSDLPEVNATLDDYLGLCQQDFLLVRLVRIDL